jgi:mRNA-degrading endonuclease toxin of MazEF toxin-antitoxin module
LKTQANNLFEMYIWVYTHATYRSIQTPAIRAQLVKWVSQAVRILKTVIEQPRLLAVVVPITNRARGYPFEVQLPVGIKTTGVVLADAIKNVDWRARNAKYTDTAPVDVMKAVRERLMALLDLEP